jgi:hypothetical protein
LNIDAGINGIRTMSSGIVKAAGLTPSTAQYR